MREKEFELRRRQLVEYMWGNSIKSQNSREAFLKVKREDFMPANMKDYAYADDAMPIGYGQTISQPSTIAIMLELLEVKEGQNVLEVGSGCGYVLALLSHLVGEKGYVFGVDIVPELVEMADKNLSEDSYENVEVALGDGSRGLTEKAPFDRILVSCSCPFIPKPLFDQLEDGGKIVAPVGDRYTQIMQTMHKKKGQMLKEDYLEGYFAFVPLRGEFGWR